MTQPKIDVETILNTLAAVRKQIPHLPPATPRDTTNVVAFPAAGDDAMELFEMATLADALESFAGDLSASIEAAREKALASALEIYYAAVELAKDPAHADLLPLIEQMRESYRRDFGTDIP